MVNAYKMLGFASSPLQATGSKVSTSKFGFFLIIFCCFSFYSPAWADDEALRKAVLVQDVEDVRAALEKGADPNYIRDDEPSALVLATMEKNVAILQMLLQHGGNPNQFNSQ